MSAASPDAADSKLSLQERQQVGIDRVGLRGRHAVREILVGFQRAVFQQFHRQRTGSDIGNDLVVLAVHHQHRYRDLLQVFGEVRLRERDDAIVMSLGAAHHALAPPVGDDRFRFLRARPIITVERPFRQSTIELRAVSRKLGLQSVEDFLGKSVWIGGRLQHQRRHRRNDRSLDEASVTVPREIAHHFPASGRVSDMNGILQIEMCRYGGKIVGVMIEVVTIEHLAGAAVAAAIVGNHAVALLEEEQHLVIPIVARQRPAVAEHDGLTLAPVLVIDFDAVPRFDKAHVTHPSTKKFGLALVQRRQTPSKINLVKKPGSIGPPPHLASKAAPGLAATISSFDFPFFLRAAIFSRTVTSISWNSWSSDLLLTGPPCPGMTIVSFVVAARLASEAAIIPSMLPPVE